MWRAGSAILLSMILAAPSFARTWRLTSDGTGDATTIQAGIDSSAVGDTLELACGTFQEYGIQLTGGIVLRSETGDPDCAVIDGLDLGPVLVAVDLAETTVLEGITITGGAGGTGPAGGGGGLRCIRSALTVSDCMFTGNASEFGGGMGCYESSPRVSGCDFVGNSATATEWAAGGGMFCRDSAPVVQDCSFSSNTAFSTTVPGDGGAMFNQSGAAKLLDCRFLANSSGAGAGGLYVFDGERSELTRCVFVDNTSGSGGAIFVETAFLEAVDCTLSHNEGESGGAVFSSVWSNLTFTGCVFSENAAAPFAGGAILAWHTTSVIRHCLFLGNTTALDGGAMACSGVTTTTFDGCRFVANTSLHHGGAIRGYFANRLDITSCTFASNVAASQGGAIFYRQSGPLTAHRTIIAFSQATWAGAIGCLDSNQLTLTCCDL
ncbi:MAG: right-handed parallel beta-helix repeat-containing protein, partial [bacterium]